MSDVFPDSPPFPAHPKTWLVPPGSHTREHVRANGHVNVGVGSAIPFSVSSLMHPGDSSSPEDTEVDVENDSEQATESVAQDGLHSVED